MSLKEYINVQICFIQNSNNMTIQLPVYLFILVIPATVIAGQSCNTTDRFNNKWFGAKCQYKCHCKNNVACNFTNGDCPNGCDSGWFGPACQFADIAKKASLNFVGESARDITVITDGNDTSCAAQTGSNSLLDVTWTFDFYFIWLRAVFKKSEIKKEDISIKFPDYPKTQPLECSNVFVDNTTIDIYCNMSKPVHEIVLNGSALDTICSLYISQGRNVALKQKTDQTSTENQNFTSSNAVDGYTNWDDYSCTQTKLSGELDPTWTLHLQNPVTVQTYTIYNRNGTVADRNCCLNQLKEFLLKTFDKSNNRLQEYKDNNTTPLTVYYVLPTNTWAQVFRAQITATFLGATPFNTKVLTLCEVEVFGDSFCDQNEQRSFTYGRDCENACNCALEGEKCFVSTGNCPSGCKTGHYGQGCTKQCGYGYYGVDCRNKCNDCLNLECNKIDGKCTICAERGKKLPHCTQDCNSGFYGPACQLNCSQFCSQTGPICDVRDGNCLNCKRGFYGANCTISCSTYCRDSVCDISSGNCISCPAGYKGLRCDEANTDDNKNPIIGAVVASMCGIIAVVLIIGGAFFLWRLNKRSDYLQGGRNTFSIDRLTEGDSLSYVASTSEQKHRKTTLTVRPTIPQKQTLSDIQDEITSGEKETVHHNTVTVQPVTASTVIPVSNLRSYLLTHGKDHLHEQFQNLPVNTEATMTVSLSAENRNKNRYKNICAYDHSRVHLEADSMKLHGDYINASYLKGYNEEEKFIASQGPNTIILNDFIRMIWEQKVEKVVMLTNLVEDGKSKCDPYWPDEGETTFGQICVKLAATQYFADYIIRRLQLYMDSHPMHPVTQFHFTSWPDNGVPENPWALVDFEQRVAAIATKRPIVVHCSAGVGRTGTFIALRNVMREAEDTQQMDFFTTVAKLRQDRTMMIQTAEQYVFLHEAAKAATTCINTTITSNNIVTRIHQLEKKTFSGKTKMEIEFDAVCSVCVEESQFTDEEESAGLIYQNSRTVSNKLKNRFGNILPKKSYRPVLMCESSEMGDYINAVLTPNFRKRNQDIITQLPLPTTVVDFWRLITQMKVSLVVAFDEELQAIDSTIGEYLPISDKEKASFPPFQVCMGTLHQGSDWEERKLIVNGSMGAEEHSLIHLRYTHNATDPKKLLSFLKHARTSNSEQEARVLYMCRNGATYSGLACVLTLLLDRMDNDHRLTVPLVVGAIKTIRPQVIPTVEQYKVLYQVLQRYNETNSVYFNFNDPKLSVPSNGDDKDDLGNVGNEGTLYANAKL